MKEEKKIKKRIKEKNKEIDNTRELEKSFFRKEADENIEDKMICKTCGNDTFRVYCTVVIDDARLYCTKCGKDPEE